MSPRRNNRATREPAKPYAPKHSAATVNRFFNRTPNWDLMVWNYEKFM